MSLLELARSLSAAPHPAKWLGAAAGIVALLRNVGPLAAIAVFVGCTLAPYAIAYLYRMAIRAGKNRESGDDFEHARAILKRVEDDTAASIDQKQEARTERIELFFTEAAAYKKRAQQVIE